MRKQIVALSLLLLTGLFALAYVVDTQAQRGKTDSGAQKTNTQPLAADYKFSGPYTHKNLTVFLVHGVNTLTGKAPLTLQEAMQQRKVKVIETGNVNQLAIENLSSEGIFVQSGDIVKGGKQDRVLAMDLIIPPHSGRVPIDSFCVEQGRWQQRGQEMVAAFSSSDQMLNHKDLKIAAKSKKSQSEVWAKVAESQTKLNENLSVIATPLPAPPSMGRGNGVGQGQGTGLAAGSRGNVGGGVAGDGSLGTPPQMSVLSAVSSTSLQLTLENKVVQETADDYVKALSSAIAGKKDVIGYAFAINGSINSADVYSSHALFVKLWPKLLKASAVEAITEFDKSKEADPVAVEAVQGFLTEAESGKAEAKQLTPRVAMEKRESDKSLFFETQDRQGQKWLHRNYLKK